MLVSDRVRSLAEAQFDVLKLQAAGLRAAGYDVISLGQAVPDFGPPPSAIAAAAAGLEQTDTHLYSPDAGLAQLRAALAVRLHQTHGADVTADEIIITAGGNQAFMVAAMTALDPGDEAVLPSPYFVNHEMAVRAVGAVPIEAPLREDNGFRPTWAEIESHLSPRTRVVVLCSPSNPTGAVVDPGELARIAVELRHRHIVLICDETYHRLVYPDAVHRNGTTLPRWREHVIVVGTFSKSFGMTGWRVGYMLASQDVCDQAIKVQDAMIICAPVISQRAVLAAVENDWDYPVRFLPAFAERRAILAREISRIRGWRWTTTMGGMFAFVHVEGCTDSVRFSTHALNTAHVVTIPGATFGAAGEGYLRLSYGAVGAEGLVEACRRLESLIPNP